MKLSQTYLKTWKAIKRGSNLIAIFYKNKLSYLALQESQQRNYLRLNNKTRMNDFLETFCLINQKS